MRLVPAVAKSRWKFYAQVQLLSFHTARPLTGLRSGPCDTAVDLAAKRDKIDRLGQKGLGTAFHGFPPRTVVAVGGDHDDGHVRARSLGLGQ